MCEEHKASNDGTSTPSHCFVVGICQNMVSYIIVLDQQSMKQFTVSSEHEDPLGHSRICPRRIAASQIPWIEVMSSE